MKRTIYLLIAIALFTISESSAQSLTADGPRQASVGQNIQISYSADAQNMENFHLGQMPDAFDVVFGPATYTSHQVSIVNGSATQKSTVTYTYTLAVRKAGTFTIPAATATVGGKQVKSGALQITVVEGQQQQQSSSSSQSQTGTPISGSDVFMQVTASKKHVYEQEAILLTYKFYTALSIQSLKGDLPDQTPFYIKELGDPNQERSIQREVYNGRYYTTLVWRQYVLFPQQTGHLRIPPVQFEATVVQLNHSIDPFEEFFNGGSSEVYSKKTIVAPAVDIQVDPLPDKPAGFSGAVGKFTMTSEIDNLTPRSNDVVTVKVKVSGVGNLQLMKQPVVRFPADFDTYDTKVSENSKITARGSEGSIEYEYTAVPRNPGKYDIPPIEFTYFDTATNQYTTLRSEPYHLDVARGEGGSGSVQNFTNQDNVESLDNDIRHIKQGDTTLYKRGEHFFGSQTYLIYLGVLVLIFISLFIIFRHRAIENADVVKARGKMANKVATKRLKKAARLMKDNRPGEFYDEALRALWGYVGDKLNMPVEQLSRENITGKLLERHVPEATSAPFIEAIDECEFERYAPGDPKGNMNKVYTKAVTAIENIEDSMKKHKVKRQPKSAMLLLMLLSMPLSAVAATESDSVAKATVVTKADADKSYSEGEYQQAIEQYEQILKTGVSADVYYNLGNAYYRTDDLTHAILNYERALRLSPADDDVKFNLQLARSKTVDKLTPESEMFFITWYRSIINLMSVDAWAWLALVSLAVAIVLALIYLFASPLWMRKTGFYGGLLMLVLFLLSNLFAWQQRRIIDRHDDAIVMQSPCNVKSTPDDSGKDLFILHEGTKVTVTDNVMKDWKEIRLPDGRKGWVEDSLIEII